MNLFSQNGWMVYWIDNIKKDDVVRERISDTLQVYYDWNVFVKRVPEVDVYFSSWSFRHRDLNQIKSKLVIYDSLDNFEKNMPEESNMISKADIVLTTSNLLFNVRKQEHSNVHLVKNGCFNNIGNVLYNMPSDLKDLKPPIILFSGALSNAWCDLELVEKIANKFTTVVVGRGWNIKEMPKGVIYLGLKSYNELQAYYHYCDINILPFKRCQISDYSNPIKIYEAMAHKKITVATNIPEALLYPDAVLPSRNHVEFINNIYRGLKLSKDDNVKQKISILSKLNTWEIRFKQIENIIDDYCKDKDIVF
jgi:glycosyltransferase involved in cell wall biosynthesis